jgi:hypothetical protein
VRGDPAMPLDDLVVYYRGIYFTTVALKRRGAKLESDDRTAFREVARYQTMAKTQLDALVETRRLHRDRA